MPSLDAAPLGRSLRVDGLQGPHSFRRRLMELGVLPGATIQKTKVAPLGDPIELAVRGSRLSIRRSEARDVAVTVET